MLGAVQGQTVCSVEPCWVGTQGGNAGRGHAVCRMGPCSMQGGAVLYAELDVLYAGWGCAVCRVGCALCRVGLCCMKSWMCSIHGGAVLYAELDVLYAGLGCAVCSVGCAMCYVQGGAGLGCMQGEAVQGGAVLCAGWGRRVGSCCVQVVGEVQRRTLCIDLQSTTTLLDLAMTTYPLSGQQLYYS